MSQAPIVVGLRLSLYLSVMEVKRSDFSQHIFFLHHLYFSFFTLLLFCQDLTTAQSITTQQTLMKCSSNGSTTLNWRPYQDSCYSAYDRAIMSYATARYICRENGGDLASVHSSDEMQFIVNLAGSNHVPFWIGLHKVYPDEYHWEDGTVVDFNNWMFEEEDLVDYGEDYYLDTCASFQPPEAYWSRSYCSDLYHVICKYNRNTRVSGTATAAPARFCPEGWYTFGDSCYTIGGRSDNEKKSFYDASIQCRANGSELVSVHSESERDILNMLMLDVNGLMWVGLHRYSSREEFIWTDGSPLDYSNWEGGKHNRRPYTENNCVQMLELPTVLGKWSNVPCGEKIAYICKKPTDPTIWQASLDASFCVEPEGWLKIKNSCYKVFNEVQNHTSWDQAQYACASSSAILASVKNFQITVELRSHMKDMSGYFWIGIRSTAKHRYAWVGGAPLIYSNWDRGQPIDVSDGNNCVAVNTDGEWMIKNCSENLPFICEVNEGSSETPVLPTASSNMTCPDYSPKWHDFEGPYCYIIEVQQKIKWYEASCACSKEGGFLASFHSSDEIDLLVKYLKDISVLLHIGFERDIRGSFVWTDRSPVDFDNWNPGEPNSEREQCTAMETDSGKWNDIHCSKRHGYICSAQKVPVADETLQPSTVSPISEPHSISSIALITICTLAVLVIASVALFYYYPSLGAKITGKKPITRLPSLKREEISPFLGIRGDSLKQDGITSSEIIKQG